MAPLSVRLPGLVRNPNGPHRGLCSLARLEDDGAPILAHHPRHGHPSAYLSQILSASEAHPLRCTILRLFPPAGVGVGRCRVRVGDRHLLELRGCTSKDE
eukprot:3768586-Prorocentrum_lima.AAC.1